MISRADAMSPRRRDAGDLTTHEVRLTLEELDLAHQLARARARELESDLARSTTLRGLVLRKLKIAESLAAAFGQKVEELRQTRTRERSGPEPAKSSNERWA